MTGPADVDRKKASFAGLRAEDRVAKSIIFVLAAIGLAGGSVLTAQVASVQNSGANTMRRSEVARDGNPNEVICRAVAPLLGSRLAPRRMCATRAQWVDMTTANRAFARRNIEQVQQALPCNASTGCLNP